MTTAFESRPSPRVFNVERGMWCSQQGQLEGVCFETPTECKRAGKACRLRYAYACFYFTEMTDARRWLCVDSYSRCTALSGEARQARTYEDVTDCWIFRKS